MKYDPETMTYDPRNLRIEPRTDGTWCIVAPFPTGQHGTRVWLTVATADTFTAIACERMRLSGGPIITAIESELNR